MAAREGAQAAWQAAGEGGGTSLELCLCLQALSCAISLLTLSSEAQLQLPIHRATSHSGECLPEQTLHSTLGC